MATRIDAFVEWLATRQAEGREPDTKEFDDFLDGLFCKKCDRAYGMICDKHDEEA